MGCTVWLNFWKVGIGQPNYAQIFRTFWQDVLIYALFYRYYLLVMFYVTLLNSLSFDVLVCNYLFGGFLKY